MKPSDFIEIGFDAVDVEMPKNKEFVSSSHSARLRRIARLTEWIQIQKPKLLAWLNGKGRILEHTHKFGFTEKAPKFWYRDEKGVNHHVDFKDLPTDSKQRILARYVRKLIKVYVAITWNFCEETTKSYISATMREIGCWLRKNHWYCDLGLEGN